MIALCFSAILRDCFDDYQHIVNCNYDGQGNFFLTYHIIPYLLATLPTLFDIQNVAIDETTKQ